MWNSRNISVNWVPINGTIGFRNATHRPLDAQNQGLRVGVAVNVEIKFTIIGQRFLYSTCLSANSSKLQMLGLSFAVGAFITVTSDQRTICSRCSLHLQHFESRRMCKIHASHRKWPTVEIKQSLLQPPPRCARAIAKRNLFSNCS